MSPTKDKGVIVLDWGSLQKGLQKCKIAQSLSRLLGKMIGDNISPNHKAQTTAAANDLETNQCQHATIIVLIFNIRVK